MCTSLYWYVYNICAFRFIMPRLISSCANRSPGSLHLDAKIVNFYNATSFRQLLTMITPTFV